MSDFINFVEINSGTSYRANISNSNGVDIEIPASYNSKPVTEVCGPYRENFVFGNIFIPNTVEKIYGFDCSYGLVFYPNYAGHIKSINIPVSINSIGAWTFCDVIVDEIFVEDLYHFCHQISMPTESAEPYNNISAIRNLYAGTKITPAQTVVDFDERFTAGSIRLANLNLNVKKVKISGIIQDLVLSSDVLETIEISGSIGKTYATTKRAIYNCTALKTIKVKSGAELNYVIFDSKTLAALSSLDIYSEIEPAKFLKYADVSSLSSIIKDNNAQVNIWVPSTLYNSYKQYYDSWEFTNLAFTEHIHLLTINNITTYFKKINKDYTLITSFDSEPEPSYILKLGEVVVYENPNPFSNEPSKCKVGDGIKTWGELEWFSDVSRVTASADTVLSGRSIVDKNGNLVEGTISAASINLNTPTIDVFGTITTKYSNTAGYIASGSGHSTASLDFDPKVCTYSVEEISGASYGFAKNPEGYWESQNKGINSSYAICRVNITVEEPSTVVFEVYNGGESGYDYGIFSALNTALPLDYNPDSSGVHASLQNKSFSDPQYVIYKINTAGTHFVDVKFRKDVSVSNPPDRLSFTIANGIEKDTKSTVIRLGYASEKSITLAAPKAAGSIITAESNIDRIYKSYDRVSSSPGDPYGGWYLWNEIPWAQIGQENGGFSATIRVTGSSTKNLIFYGGTEPLIIELNMAAAASTSPGTVYPSADLSGTVYSTAYITYNPLIDAGYSINTIHILSHAFVTQSSTPSDTTYWLRGNVQYMYDDRSSPSYRSGYYVQISPPDVYWQGPYYDPYVTGTFGYTTIDPTSDKIRYSIRIYKPM